MPFARTREGMIILGDVFWGRVNSSRADRSVSCRVGGAAVAVIIGALDDLHLYYTHMPPRHRAVGSLCLVASTSYEEKPWV
jgi:hypothetical protein